MLFPSPSSSDRKEIYRERRPVRSESLGNSPVASRWKDSPSFGYRGNHHAGRPREFSRREDTDYRRHPGRGRQQSDWHMFPEESGYAYMPSRSCERIVEDRSHWISSSARVDGRYYRSGTDYNKVRGYQKDWEGLGWHQNNSFSTVLGGKPLSSLYGGKSCNEFADMSVERRSNGMMYHGFEEDRHFNMSPVVFNGRTSNRFSGASVEKNRNGFSPRNGYSQRNASESHLILLPADSCDKQSLGHSNASVVKTRDGFSGHSVTKRHNQAPPSITADRPINLSTSFFVDRANDGFSCSPAVKASNKYSTFAADRSNQIPPGIAKPSFVNATVDTKHGGHCDSLAENNDDGLSSFVSAEGPIIFPSSVTSNNLNTELTGTPVGKTPENIHLSLADGGMTYHKPSTTPVSNIDNDFAHKGLAIIPEEKPCISVGVSANNICDGMARSVFTVIPKVNIDGKLSNIENEPKCMKLNIGCLNMFPESSLKHQPDIDPVDTPRHNKENFLGIDWKPLKYIRSGSLSLCSHSYSFRSIPPDSKETIDNSSQGNGTALCSPAADNSDCLVSSAAIGEAPASKKARLGWGQGLAKYEKKVVGDPCVAKQNEICSSKVGGKCTMVTPTSATCSLLPDSDDKSLKEENMLNSFQLSGSESDIFPSSFEKLDMGFITTEVHRLLSMVHSDDRYPTGSISFHESTDALSKLLLWKTLLFKVVEMTDSEIESLEGEIQSSGSRNNVRYQAAPTHLQIDSSVVREGIDSHGTATSDSLVSLSKVEESLQAVKARQDASMNSSHMMVKLTHTCTAHTQENYDINGMEGSRLCEFICPANKEIVKKASDELAQLVSESETSVANCQEFTNDMLVRDEVVNRKKLLRFSERAATLKYRALQQLWKEDARLLEIRKNCLKSSKRLELGTQTSQNAHLKSSLFHSRVSLTEESTKLVPSSQTVSLMSSLLTDFPAEVFKDELKMPPLVLDEKENQMSRFVSYNGLVEDPVAVEKERALMTPWTQDEKETFLDKLAVHGKNFRKIASHLEHKTTADCVEFYYKNHKSALFERTQKKPVSVGIKSKSASKAAYMLTSIDKWNQEHAAADVLAGISGSVSSEVINPCISSSFNHTDVHRQWKRKKIGGKRKRTCSQEMIITPNNEETFSGESCGGLELSVRDWTDKEKHKLLEAVKLYGNNYELVSEIVKTRCIYACKAFYSKVKKRLGSSQTKTNINTSGMRLDSKLDIDVRLKTPLVEPVL